MVNWIDRAMRNLLREAHMKLGVGVYFCIFPLFPAPCPSSIHLSIHGSTHSAPGWLQRDHITSAKVCRLGNTSPHPDQKWLSTHCSVFEQYAPVVSCYDWWRRLVMGQCHTAEVIIELEPRRETIHRICRNALSENLYSNKGTFNPRGPISLRNTFSDKSPSWTLTIK